MLSLQTFWRDGRAVECGSLENCFIRKGNGGSNPSLSATLKQSVSNPFKIAYFTVGYF